MKKYTCFRSYKKKAFWSFVIALTCLLFSFLNTDSVFAAPQIPNYRETSMRKLDFISESSEEMPTLEIITQPQNVRERSGEEVKFSIEAKGEGILYQWYYKMENADFFSVWKGRNQASFTYQLDDKKNGMQVYCIITDSSGNSISSDTVTITVLRDLAITTQPQDAKVNVGEVAVFTVEAVGQGLEYQWFFKSPSSGEFTLWAGKTASSLNYTVTSTDKNGMQIRCIIKDEQKNRVTSESVILSILGTEENENNGLTNSIGSDENSQNENGHSEHFSFFGCSNLEEFLMLIMLPVFSFFC